MKTLRTIYLVLVFQGLLISLFSQKVSDYAVINDVNISGNKKTKTIVILRELDLFPGDTVWLNTLPRQLGENQKRLLSTALFTDVVINIKNWDTKAKTLDISISVQENWYLFPSLIFELADRNFSVWWEEMNRSLDRVNYGLRLDHINLTGRRDRLKLKAQFGYTRKYELRYEYPYINNEWGFSANLFYSDNKEIGYITVGNKTLFQQHPEEEVMLSRFRTGGSINRRTGLFAYHALRMEYHHNQVNQYVAEELNSDYFLDQRTSLRFFHLEYDFQYDRRIFFQYPQGGYKFFFNIKKEGLGLFNEYSNLPVFAGWESHTAYKKLIFSGRLKAKTTLIRDLVAFANNTGLGYGEDIITGYQLYVIDGMDYLLWQSALKFNIIDTVIDWEDKMPLSQFQRMSLRVFLRFNLSTGYVNEPTYITTNFLNNQWAWGYGPAIDILLWNTFQIGINYNFNELGESGYFFQSGFAF